MDKSLLAALFRSVRFYQAYLSSLLKIEKLSRSSSALFQLARMSASVVFHVDGAMGSYPSMIVIIRGTFGPKSGRIWPQRRAYTVRITAMVDCLFFLQDATSFLVEVREVSRLINFFSVISCKIRQHDLPENRFSKRARRRSRTNYAYGSFSSNSAMILDALRRLP